MKPSRPGLRSILEPVTLAPLPPVSAPPEPRPLRAASAVLLAAISFLTVWLVMILGVALSRGGSVVVFLAASLVVGPLVALYVGLVRYAPHLPTSEAVGVRPPRGREWALIGLGLLVGVGLAPGTFEITNRLIEAFPPPRETDPEVAEMAAMPGDAGSRVIILVAILIVGPLATELLFRGLMLRRLREGRGAYVAFVTVTLLSGFRPAVTQAIPAMLLVAAALTTLGLRARTVWVTVIAHIAHVTASGLLEEGPETTEIVAASPLSPGLIAGGTALAALALAVAWRVGRPADHSGSSGSSS